MDLLYEHFLQRHSTRRFGWRCNTSACTNGDIRSSVCPTLKALYANTSVKILKELVAKKFTYLVQGIKSERWKLSLERMLSHSSIPGNERADVSATVAHVEESSITLKRMHVTRRFIHGDVKRHRPHPNIAQGSPPNHARNHRISHPASTSLHRLRIDDAYGQERSFLLGLEDTEYFLSCSALEHL